MKFLILLKKYYFSLLSESNVIQNIKKYYEYDQHEHWYTVRYVWDFLHRRPANEIRETN